MPAYNNQLDRKIISVSDEDHLPLRAFVEGGTFVVGGLGAGKSSTSFRQILKGFMLAKMGGVICTVKSEDAQNAIALAGETGCLQNVVLFNEQSGLTFDPLAFECSGKERGAINIESLVDFCSILLSIGQQQNVTTEQFWANAANQAIRNAIRILMLASEPPSIVNIYRTLESFPQRVGEHEEEGWQNRSYFAQLVDAIRLRKDSLTPEEWSDLEVATQFIFFRWPSFDERPRSSIEMTIAGMCDRFLFHPLRRIFASGTFSFTPWQTTHEGKIIIIDFPVLEYGKETARLIQILIKLTFQRAWLKHKFTPGCCNGAFLIQDEFQFLMSKFENHFVQVCRSSAIAVVCATQSIMGLAEEMGETQPGSKTKGFLNNLSIKIAHNITCPDTAAYIADVIGKEFRLMEGFSGSTGGGNPNSSVSGSQQLVHVIEPIEFTRLLKPDGTNPYAEAIVWLAGRTFNATKTPQYPEGRNYLRVLFSREA